MSQENNVNYIHRESLVYTEDANFDTDTQLYYIMKSTKVHAFHDFSRIDFGIKIFAHLLCTKLWQLTHFAYHVHRFTVDFKFI